MSNLIDIYKFKNISGFYADMRGNFFTEQGDRPLKKEAHEGRVVIRFNNKRFGLKTLRRLAYKSQKEMLPVHLPF